jgi:hypothetical protein
MHLHGVGQFLSHPLCEDADMNKKQRFLDAVRILAPDDGIIISMAAHVDEAALPAFPGGAALEFVAGMQRWFPKASHIPAAMGPPAGELERVPNAARSQLSLSHALRVQSAEYWLELGEPEQALRELERLPEGSRSHPRAIRAGMAAVAALRERGELAVQA